MHLYSISHEWLILIFLSSNSAYFQNHLSLAHDFVFPSKWTILDYKIEKVCIFIFAKTVE